MIYKLELAFPYKTRGYTTSFFKRLELPWWLAVHCNRQEWIQCLAARFFLVVALECYSTMWYQILEILALTSMTCILIGGLEYSHTCTYFTPITTLLISSFCSNYVLNTILNSWYVSVLSLHLVPCILNRDYYRCLFIRFKFIWQNLLWKTLNSVYSLFRNKWQELISFMTVLTSKSFFFKD